MSDEPRNAEVKPKREKLDERRLRGFLVRLAEHDRDEMARLDRRRVEVLARARTIVVSNGKD